MILTSERARELTGDRSFYLSSADIRNICSRIYQRYATDPSNPELRRECISLLKGWQVFFRNARDKGQMASHPSRMELDVLVGVLHERGVHKRTLLQRIDRILRNDRAYRAMKSDFYESMGSKLENDRIPLFELMEMVRLKNPPSVRHLEREVITMAKANPKTAKIILDAQRKAGRTVTPSRITLALKEIDRHIHMINDTYRKAREEQEIQRRKAGKYAQKYGKYIK